MQYLDCPNCGPRDEDEFEYGGIAHVTRPEPAESVSDEDWMRYLFVYPNPKGANLERWVHVYGCRQWFNVLRNTMTHEVGAVYRIGEDAPVSATTPAGNPEARR